MKKYLILITLILAVLSCRKSQNNSLSGEYIEVSPTANANRLNFIYGNQVIITSSQIANQLNLVPGIFTYHLSNGIITLASSSLSHPYNTSFLFQSIGKDSLSLDYNCGCLCPCPSTLNLFFVKK